MSNSDSTRRKCFRCETPTGEYCGMTGLAFCTAQHQQQHWDENAWLYTLRGKRDKHERKKAKSAAKGEKSMKRTFRPSDKASIVARAISQMPEGTMSEREAIHLNELKTRFDNARDSHRKTLKAEALHPSDDPEIVAIRASAAMSRLEEIRKKRQAALDEFERLALGLERTREEAARRQQQAIIAYEYVLQEQVRFEDRSADDKLDDWQMPSPSPSPTTTVTIKRAGDNSDAKQVVIEVEEPTSVATSTASDSEPSSHISDDVASDNGDGEMDVVPAPVAVAVVDTQRESGRSDSETDAFGSYDALMLYPDGQWRFSEAHFEPQGEMLPHTAPTQHLPGALYTYMGGATAESPWAQFVAENYGYEGLQGTAYVYPPDGAAHFASDQDVEKLQQAARKYARANMGRDTRMPDEHELLVLHMDGTYEVYTKATDDDIDGSDWPIEVSLRDGEWYIYSSGSDVRTRSAHGASPWVNFLYDRLGWAGTVYDGNLIVVARDSYERIIDVTQRDAFMRQVANESAKLVKTSRPSKK